MVKAVIFDCDGMVNHEKRFSERLAAYVPLEISLPFFRNEFQQCVVGKADLKEELSKKLLQWHWEGTVDELLAFWLSDEANTTDEAIVATIRELRAKGVRCYLATNNEKYRSRYLMIDRGLGEMFDAVFASYGIGAKKPEKEFYDYIFSHIPESRETVLYWDDDAGHIGVAETLGIPSRLFTTVADFRSALF
jgi:putative hydrolase of the HAD superfamily